MFKEQVFSPYLYQNQKGISTYTLYFFEKVSQIYIIMIPKTLVFLTHSYQNHPSVSAHIFVKIGKITSNLHSNDVQKSSIGIDLFVPKSQKYFDLHFETLLVITKFSKLLEIVAAGSLEAPGAQKL